MEKYNLEYLKSLPKFDESVSWLCWAYNENELIGPYLERVDRLLRESVADYEIIVVDDGSTDGTSEIIEKLQKTLPKIILLKNGKNMDVGYSAQLAIKKAGKKYLMWQTIDWCYDITYFRVFLELLKKYDIVAGVRRAPVKTRFLYKPLMGVLKLFGIRHLTKRSDTISKAFISVINYSLIRLLFGLRLSDYQNVVFYPTKHIQSVAYESNSPFSNPEGLLKSHWLGKSIIEVPISFIPRSKGKAKGTRMKSIHASVRDILYLWVKWIVLGRRDFRKNGEIKRLNPEEWDPDLLSGVR